MICLEAYRSRIGGYVSTARRITFQSSYFRLYKNSGVPQEKFHHYNFWHELLCVGHILCLFTIICLSLYTNYQQLLQDGDIESNPGPFKASKVVLGSFNQGDVVRFGESAGI